MDREKQIKTLTDDINIYLDFDGTCECVKEDGECYPNYRVTIETPSLAKRLVNHGWSKIVWHKVADGDLPKYPTFYFCHYKGIHINSGEPYEADHEMYWNGKRFITDSTNQVIAWTELPTYEE